MDENDFLRLVSPEWRVALADELSADYWRGLQGFVREEYGRGVCYPPRGQVFAALELCPLSSVRVVVLGQDPYHEAGQAEGLCFSVPAGVRLPPSLVNIFKEVGGVRPASGSLVVWARQGVLLLNSVLTVRAGVAGSHAGRGWERFTDAVIRAVSERPGHVVFMLWGAAARRKRVLVDTRRHLVLEAVHPSPLAACRGGWFGCGHFTKCNDQLLAWGLPPVEWA